MLKFSMIVDAIIPERFNHDYKFIVFTQQIYQLKLYPKSPLYSDEVW